MCSRSGPSHVIDFTPLLLVGVGPGDPSESGEEPFRHGVDGVGGGYTGKLRPAGGDVEAKEVLHRHQVGSRNARSEAVFTSHFFGRSRLSTLCGVTLHHPEMPPSEGVSGTGELGGTVMKGLVGFDSHTAHNAEGFYLGPEWSS